MSDVVEGHDENQEKVIYKDSAFRVLRSKGNKRRPEAFAPMLPGQTMRQFAEAVLFMCATEQSELGHPEIVELGLADTDDIANPPAENDPFWELKWLGFPELRHYRVMPSKNLIPPDPAYWYMEIAGIAVEIFYSDDLEERERLAWLLGRRWDQWHFYRDRKKPFDAGLKSVQGAAAGRAGLAATRSVRMTMILEGMRSLITGKGMSISSAARVLASGGLGTKDGNRKLWHRRQKPNS